MSGQLPGGRMFQRSTGAPSPLTSLTSTTPATEEMSRSAGPARSPAASTTPHANVSVIGNDLTILGKDITIISKGSLQLDGEVQANVHGAEIVIGEAGKVVGTVAAEKVVIRGTVSGVVRAMHVALESGAHVEGEIHHSSLAVDPGAYFDGRVRRPKDTAELRPVLDPTQHEDHVVAAPVPADG